METEEDVKTSWNTQKHNTKSAAEEALGKRNINKNSKMATTPWYKIEVKEIINE